MPKFDKPDSPNIIWGVNALDADLTKPDDSYIQTGWTQVKPPYEYENYSMNKLYQGFAYYNQLGIPEWDSVTEYQAGKSYVQGSNNLIYKCTQTHVNKNPAMAGNESFWEVFEGNRQATTTNRGTVRYATDNQASQALSNNTSLSPSNLLAFIGSGLLGTNGYFEVPVNVGNTKKVFIVNFGQDISRGSSIRTINFSKSFPTNCSTVLASEINSSQTGAFRVHRVSDITKSNFTIQNDSGNSTDDLFGWIAIGY